MEMVKHFLLTIANIKPDWSMKEVIDMQIKAIHDLVRNAWSQLYCVYLFSRPPTTWCTTNGANSTLFYLF